MKELGFEEAKRIEFDILSDVADFCEKNNLRYFLAYGTLIGAIRHKGFIPWDDDIDIQMPRKDYEIFLKTYNKSSNGIYYAVSPLDKTSKHGMAKVIDTRTVKIESGISYKKNAFLGVDIDVFPIDGQPDDDLTYFKYYKKKQKYLKLHSVTVKEITSHRVRNIPISVLLKLIGKNYFIYRVRKIEREYIYDDCEYVGATSSYNNSIKNRTKRENYDTFVHVDFEGRKFRAPVGYDDILTEMYGDYMKLPPEEKQVPHHENNMYWK